MNEPSRDSAIETIGAYVRQSHEYDHCFPEMLGIAPSRSDITDEQWFAAVDAVLPLLPDERLTVLMFHVAEMLTSPPDRAEAERAEILERLTWLRDNKPETFGETIAQLRALAVEQAGAA